MKPIDSFDLEEIRKEATKKLLEKQEEKSSSPVFGKPFEKEKFISYASNLINRKFEIDDKNLKIVSSLWDYFFNPAKFDEENTVYSSGKGIMLYGAPGGGKTELMRIFCNLAKGISDIEFDFARFYNLSARVEELGNKAFNQSTKNFLFDELGLERSKSVKHYGAAIDIDEEVILIRYDKFRNGSISHFTTNLTAEMIKTRYNPRVLSRLNEMCNVMSLTGVDRRATARPKRKY